ncbi:MAG: hypothetical protein ACTSWN_08705, partial [Promethearchaeota archaeon]
MIRSDVSNEELLMHIAPFTNREIEQIKEALDSFGWKEQNDLCMPLSSKGNYKYYINERERVVGLTAEFHILPPFKSRKYFPLGRIKFGLLACPGLLRGEYLKKLFIYWAGSIKNLELEIFKLFQLERLTDVKRVETDKDVIEAEFLNQVPEPTDNRDENFYFQRVRIHLSRAENACDYVTCKKLVKALKEINIHPHNKFDDIAILHDGISPALIDRFLMFKNPNIDEIVFLEPGFVTFYRDSEIENVQFRAYFDSFALIPLIKIWKVDISEFISGVIKAIRLAFARFLNATGVMDFKKIYFIKKNFDLFTKVTLKNANPIRTDDTRELVLPVPNVLLDILQTTSPTFPSWNIFIKPPESFDELRARRILLDSRQNIKRGSFQTTVTALSSILPIFNKSGQKYAFFLTVVELARIAVRMN